MLISSNFTLATNGVSTDSGAKDALSVAEVVLAVISFVFDNSDVSIAVPAVDEFAALEFFIPFSSFDTLFLANVLSALEGVIEGEDEDAGTGTGVDREMEGTVGPGAPAPSDFSGLFLIIFETFSISSAS